MMTEQTENPDSITKAIFDAYESLTPVPGLYRKFDELYQKVRERVSADSPELSEADLLERIESLPGASVRSDYHHVASGEDFVAVRIPGGNPVPVLSEEARAAIAGDIQRILKAIGESKLNAWHNIADLGNMLKRGGFDFREYGYSTLMPLLKTVFGTKMDKVMDGRILWVKFRFGTEETKTEVSSSPRIEKRSEKSSEKGQRNSRARSMRQLSAKAESPEFPMFEGFIPGDTVEITAFGVTRRGRIKAFGKDYVELCSECGRMIRIRNTVVGILECISRKEVELVVERPEVASEDKATATAKTPDGDGCEVREAVVEEPAKETVPEAAAQTDVYKETENEAETSGEAVSPAPEERAGNQAEGLYSPASFMLGGPRILGKIDLSRVDSFKDIQRRKNALLTSEANEPAEGADKPEAEEPKPLQVAEEDLLPANGTLLSIGPKFGWVKPMEPSDSNIYMPLSEIVRLNGVIDAPKVGDEVIYSLGQNAHGNVAVCVHKRCSRHVVEELIERLGKYDSRKAQRLRERIADADAEE